MFRSLEKTVSQSFKLIAMSLVIATVVATSAPDAQAQTFTHYWQADMGLAKTFFKTSKGMIQVNIPYFTFPGDTISGTIFVWPHGSSDSEKNRNSATLNSYSIEVMGKTTPVSDGDFIAEIPASVTTLDISLKDKSGRAASKETFTLKGPAPAAGTNLFLPTYISAGRPFQVFGRFDGKLGTTKATFDGQEATMLAESPRQLMILAPPEKSGPMKFEVNVVRGTSTYRAGSTISALALNLSQSHSFVWKGKTYKVTLKVYGTGALNKPVGVELENKNPDVAELVGGNKQTITIEPNTDGYSIERDVKGLKAGTFTIKASIANTNHVSVVESN